MPTIGQRGTRRSWPEISHPRGGFHWGDLPAEHQETAEHGIESLGGGGANVGQVRSVITGRAEEFRARVAGGERLPAKAAEAHQTVEKAMTHLDDIGPTGMDTSVKTIRNAAMLPIKAERAHARATGEMRAPLAGGYYPARHNVGRIIGEHTFGKGSEGAFGTMMASPLLSARTPPQIEVAGGAGMAAVMKGGEDIGIHIGHQSAKYLNERLRGTKAFQPVEEGRTNFTAISQRHPLAAALLLQHGATESGIIVPKQGKIEDYSAGKVDRDESLRSDARIHIPAGLEEPVGAFVSSGGVSGYPKLASAIGRFNDPTSFGKGDFHKLPSYAWNIHSAGHPDIQQGVHHMLGAMTHGDRWFEAHPEAEGHIRKAMAHPAWHDPTSTQDVWAARLNTGLHPHVAMALGENINPESVMHFAGLGGGTARTKRSPYGNASDLGYLYGEEAHRRAAQSMSVKLPGGGRAHAPASVAQSLSWFGVQAQANPEMVKSGKRTLTPASMHDPRGLNPLRVPRMWS